MGLENLETERLALRRLTLEDAQFIMDLVTDPDWIRFIGDRNVHSLEDARNYIQKGPIASYLKFDFGLLMVESKESREPLGMCGLMKRDSLEDVDIGYAFLPKARGMGYAYEAAAAVQHYALDVLRLPRIVAIVTPDNRSSIRVLEKLGMNFLRRLPPDAEGVELLLYTSSVHTTAT